MCVYVFTTGVSPLTSEPSPVTVNTPSPSLPRAVSAADNPQLTPPQQAGVQRPSILVSSVEGADATIDADRNEQLSVADIDSNEYEVAGRYGGRGYGWGGRGEGWGRGGGWGRGYGRWGILLHNTANCCMICR